MHQPASDIILQFVPLFIFSLIYAVPIFIIAQKRKVNPWLWTVGTLVPLFGLFVAAIFFVTTIMSMIDRLDALETDAVGKTFT